MTEETIKRKPGRPPKDGAGKERNNRVTLYLAKETKDKLHAISLELGISLSEAAGEAIMNFDATTRKFFDVLEKALNASAKSDPCRLPFAKFLSTIESTETNPQKTMFISVRVADQELADRELPHQLNCCFKFGRTLILCDICFAVRLARLIGRGTLPQRFGNIEVPGVTKLDITLDTLRKVKDQVDCVAAVITLSAFGSDKLDFYFTSKLANFAPDEDGCGLSDFHIDASIKEPEEPEECVFFIEKLGL